MSVKEIHKGVKPTFFLHINKFEHDGKELCETAFLGSEEIIASLIYSAMKSNMIFAEMVEQAVEAYRYSIDRETALN